MKKIKFLAFAFATMFTMGMVSCGDKEESTPVENLQEATLTANSPITITDWVCSKADNDSAGYPVHFSIVLKDGKLVARGLTHVARPDIPGSDNYHGTTAARIKDKGDVSELGNVIGKPSMDLTSDSTCDAAAGRGYIVKAWGTSEWDKTGNRMGELGYHDPDPLYLRLWLKETSGDGYKVQYEVRYK